MANTTSVQNALGATNKIMLKLEQVRTLMRNNIQGVGENILRGIKTLASIDLPFPFVMIQPRKTVPVMAELGKTDTWYTFDIYWWAGNENVEEVSRQVTDLGEIFQKLFSNNANGDLSGLYKNNPGQWVDSKMSTIQYGAAMKAPPKKGRSTYAALGYMQLAVRYVEVK